MSNSAWNAFKQKVTEYLKLQDVKLTNDQSWIIGVSGGADSIALLHVLAELKKNLIVAHVNYHKRGIESDKDEQFVKYWVEKYNFPFFVKDGTINESGNFQELARVLRYNFFQELKDRFNASFIVTAHHLDDYSENVLFRTLRGSSSETILSLRSTQSNLLRPFANIRSSEIRKVLLELGLEWREDHSNSESVYTRNWLRNDVIPELDERIPGWNQHLLEKANLEFELVQELSKLHQSEIYIESNKIFIDLILFQKLSFRIIKALIFKRLAQLNWQVSFSAIDEILQLISSQKGKKIQLAVNLFALRSVDKIQIFQKEFDLDRFELIESIKKNELIQILDFEFELISREEIENLTRKEHFFLDFSKIAFPIKIRSWQHGDRILPLGLRKGSKLVSDIITESKIDINQKKQVLVIHDASEICLAVCFPKGFEAFNRITESIKVSEKTKEVLHIKRISN